MLLLLGASRRAFEAQSLVRTGEWTIPRAAALLGWQITGKTLGIVGMGAHQKSCRETCESLWDEDRLLRPT